MGGGGIDNLEEVGHKLQVVYCDVEKLIILGYLVLVRMSIMRYGRVKKNKPPVARESKFPVQRWHP